jgi:hypothetical protein
MLMSSVAVSFSRFFLEGVGSRVLG